MQTRSNEAQLSRGKPNACLSLAMQKRTRPHIRSETNKLSCKDSLFVPAMARCLTSRVPGAKVGLAEKGQTFDV